MKNQPSFIKQKKMIARWSVGILLAAVLGGLVWYAGAGPSGPTPVIIAQNGIHWHSELAIYVKGEKQEIPKNIGIGAVHRPVHTHDDAGKGVIHLEFQGLVQEKDIVLAEFFKSWGKDLRSFGSNVTMTVNGKESTEFENYVMRDKDKIELRYE